MRTKSNKLNTLVNCTSDSVFKYDSFSFCKGFGYFAILDEAIMHLAYNTVINCQHFFCLIHKNSLFVSTRFRITSVIDIVINVLNNHI